MVPARQTENRFLGSSKGLQIRDLKDQYNNPCSYSEEAEEEEEADEDDNVEEDDDKNYKFYGDDNMEDNNDDKPPPPPPPHIKQVFFKLRNITLL